MSFNLVQDCIDLRPGIFTPAQKFALIVICRFADDDGRNSFPKLKTIAERSEFNRRTILEAVKFLISAGWVSAVRNQYGRSFTVNLGKIRQNQIVDSEVQDHAHVQEVVHVQETAHRCAGSCTAEVQDHAHIRNQLRNQLKNQVEAPVGAPAEVAPWELPLEPPAANYADSTLKTVAQPAEKLDSHTAYAPVPKAKRQKNPPVPYQKIVDLYNERCTPTLSRAKSPSDSLKSAIKARFFDLQKMTGAKTEDETLFEFAKFFDLVAQSNFLCGRVTSWSACFPWLMQRSKFEAVLNGQYRNHSQQKLPPHKDPAFHFDKAYYDQSIKPDGSTDWGD